MFYTRIPCPAYVDHGADYINKATRYFPLIGWIVGGVSCLVFWVSNMLLGVNLAIVFSLITGILITGAFHEDGLADVFDGFGGGWTKAKILEIMKDSRVGAYGVIGLILMFLLKFFALQNLVVLYGVADVKWLVLFYINYHALARLTAIQIVFTEQYSREDETSKAKPIAKAHTYKEIVGAYFFGLIPLLGLVLLNYKFALVLLILYGVYFFSKRYFNKWIGGYTGDCLGAVEQIAECVVLIFFVAIWKFM
jgi:adenosylcobinamide-GDP ribazoletransferase